MKLTYWIADSNDAPCYSIRKRTRREVRIELGEVNQRYYGKPRKVTVEYANAFDLLLSCTGEGGIPEGRYSERRYSERS